MLGGVTKKGIAEKQVRKTLLEWQTVFATVAGILKEGEEERFLE